MEINNNAPKKLLIITEAANKTLQLLKSNRNLAEAKAACDLITKELNDLNIKLYTDQTNVIENPSIKFSAKSFKTVA